MKFNVKFFQPFRLLVFLVVICSNCSSCTNESSKLKEDSLQETNLQGTKWKLAGIVDVQTGDIKELDPKDCDECYTLTFDTDSTAVGWITSNDLIVRLRSVLEVFSASKALGSDFYIEDAILFRSIIGKINSYKLYTNELKFYYNDNKNYLLFKQRKS